MVYLKHARMRGGNFRLDDYEDAVSYEALMAEEASTDPSAESPEKVVLYDGRYISTKDLLQIAEEITY